MSRIENALEKASRMPIPEQATPRPLKQFETAVAAGDSGGPLRNPYLVTVNDPDSPAAEEYRKLKAMVVKITRQEQLRNCIMVTSCSGGEGKSLTSINLAVSLAQEAGSRVLLIDADLRRPMLATYLGIDPKAGLVDCLRDGVSPLSAVVGAGVPRLDILPAGNSVRNPGELLTSQRMKAILGEMKRSDPARFIIIDTPPVLPFAETQVLSTMVDGVLLVVKEGATTVEDLQDALETVQGTKVLGLVFNDVTASGKNSRYYHYYRYYGTQQKQQQA